MPVSSRTCYKQWKLLLKKKTRPGSPTTLGGGRGGVTLCLGLPGPPAPPPLTGERLAHVLLPLVRPLAVRERDVPVLDHVLGGDTQTDGSQDGFQKDRSRTSRTCAAGKPGLSNPPPAPHWPQSSQCPAGRWETPRTQERTPPPPPVQGAPGWQPEELQSHLPRPVGVTGAEPAVLVQQVLTV